MFIAEDLTGRTFGDWLVLERDKTRKNAKVYWVCKCKQCGTIKSVRADALKRGKSLSCKSCARTKHKNMEGKIISSWKILEKINSKQYKCLCTKCGSVHNIHIANIISGKSTCCINCRGDKLKKHGLGKTRLYSIYHHIKERCFNKNNDSFHNYGGRGITVCPEWLGSFMNFYNWAIRSGYQDNLSIDRIDVNGNYCPENCRWADYQMQAENTRRTHLIEFKGQKHSLMYWCKQLNLCYPTILGRIKRGMTFEEAIKKN